MAIITQKFLLNWKEIEASSDIERLNLVLEVIPDEALMKKLEKKRKGKRDKNPIRAIWNSILAGIVYQHPSIESLRRELKRNAELREACGFNPFFGSNAVPSQYAYNRFLKKLIKEEKEINQIFDNLVSEIKRLIPEFGEHLGIDGKELKSYAVGKKELSESSDPEADWGVKKYEGKNKDGSTWEKVKSWFGYKLHLVIDTKYEIPIGYEVTKASISDTTRLLPIIKEIKEKHPEIINRARDLSADKGYDSTRNNTELYDEYGIKPVIDIKNCWKSEKGQEINTRPLYEDKADNIVYDYKGGIYCLTGNGDNFEKDYTAMSFFGFDKNRESLKYRCPAAAFGIKCENKDKCGTGDYGEYGRVVRIALEKDRRIFTPIARSSNTFKRIYKGRTAVERVNSRIDNVFGFEKHYIRGMAKMKMRINLAMIVMLSIAVGRIKRGEKEKLRSLVKSSAA